jgi:hypothetical protein
MKKDGFERFASSTSIPESTHSAHWPRSNTGGLVQAVKKYILPWALVFVLSFSFSTAHTSQQQAKIPREQFDTLYIEGKHLFYEILRREAQKMQLVDKEREMLSKAQKKIPGLYEHLMNFYHFHKKPDRKKGVNFQSRLLNFSRNMAEEFIQSISEFSSNGEVPSLESVLYSTGYFSRKMFPIYREYRRPIGKQVRAQWAFKQLKIKEVHSLSKGKGIKLAIIDTGVDPTLKEIRSRIVKWKDFLDGSKPAFDNGKFPFDWSGHGTSIASVVFQVAPEIELAIVKVYDNETMNTVPPSRWSAYLYAAGMIWAAENGADIINLSAVFRTDTKAIREAAKYCWEKNIVVVSPVANVSKNEGDQTLSFPAAYPWTIAVGGVEKNNGKLRVSELSSEAVYLDVVAPASGIYAEMPSYLDRKVRPQYTHGNSMAVPFVAGTASLMLSAMDDQALLKLKERPGNLVETIRIMLRKTSSNAILGFEKPNPTSGYGYINIQKAVEMARSFRIE